MANPECPYHGKHSHEDGDLALRDGAWSCACSEPNDAAASVEADAKRWRAVTRLGSLIVNEDGALAISIVLKPRWYDAEHLTAEEHAILGGEIMDTYAVSGRAALDRAIDTAREVAKDDAA